MIRIIGSHGGGPEPIEFDERIRDLEAELMNLIESCAQGDCSEEAFDREYKKITEELKALRRERGQASREKQLADAYEQRAEEVDCYIKHSNWMSREFDDDLVWRLLQTVKVINQNKIEIQFRSGIVMVQRLDFEE